MSWQLVTTAPNAEMRVSRMLDCLNFEHRIYRFRRKIALRGKVVDHLAPLFPRYIFIKALRCWDLVRSITGVVDFVRWDGAIVDVASQEMTRLESMANSQHVLFVEPSVGKFKPGERIRIVGLNSLVFGMNGIYQHAVGADKAYVLLPWFNGQLTGTVVDEADVEKVESRVRKKRSRRRRNRSNRTSTYSALAVDAAVDTA